MSRTIQDVLERVSAGIGGMVLINKKYEDGIEVDQALKEIEELILESLPEKLGMTGANAQDVENFGYNQALSDTKANLLKILGGENGE